MTKRFMFTEAILGELWRCRFQNTPTISTNPLLSLVMHVIVLQTWNWTRRGYSQTTSKMINPYTPYWWMTLMAWPRWMCVDTVEDQWKLLGVSSLILAISHEGSLVNRNVCCRFPRTKIDYFNASETRPAYQLSFQRTNSLLQALRGRTTLLCLGRQARRSTRLQRPFCHSVPWQEREHHTDTSSNI